MPVYGCVPAGRPTNELEGYEIHTYVPADDTHCWRYDIGFRRDRAVREEEVHRRKQISPDYMRVRNARNNYLQDRAMGTVSGRTRHRLRGALSDLCPRHWNDSAARVGFGNCPGL